MENYNDALRAETAAYMEREGVTQARLAKMLGVTPSRISRVLKGALAFRVPELYGLARIGVQVPPLDADRRDR